jgi:hypothetical protein
MWISSMTKRRNKDADVWERHPVLIGEVITGNGRSLLGKSVWMELILTWQA